MYKLSLFAFLLGSITFWGCKEPDVTPDNNKEFPIAIEVKENPSGGLEISWNPVNINKFESYTLIRSVDSVGFSGFVGDTLWTIEDINQNKVIDKNLPLIGKIYYRFFVNIKGRALQANTVAYQRKDIFTFDNLVYNVIFYNPSKNLIYLSNNQGIRTINVQTGELSKTVDIAPASGSGKSITFTQEDPDNIYVINENQIEIYDAVNLTLRHTIKNSNYPTDRFMAITSGYGKYYVSMYGYPMKVKAFDASSKALLKTYNTTFNIDAYMGIKILPGQKRLLSVTYNSQDDEAILFDLDDNGNIISHNKVVDNSYPFSSYYSAVAPNGESIVFNRKYIMDKDLKQIGILPANNTSSSNPLYSPNGLYLLTDDAFSGFQIIDMKTFQVFSTIPFKSSSSNFSFVIFLTNTEYVSFGETFLPSGSRRITISKTKFL